MLDARACLPVLVFVVSWSWTTFYIALTRMIAFSVTSWAGMTVPVTLRLVRRVLVGHGGGAGRAIAAAKSWKP
ncbi:hypothetical protein M2322_004838 [Rhodoblastus acidophilus]|uniref:IcmT/TraK family protein n=1 Tax=Rhodoblastus acidophilus TaxID=1074 RepID=UPI002224472F|nr:IcmT/TraK family protein [Rhodoblastus acidophilus]MCW2319269.1 hypothetical protein [Rhodoblastus acidophilus]